MLKLYKADTPAVCLIHITQVLSKYRGVDYVWLLSAGDFSQDIYTLMSHLFTYPMPKHVFLTDEKFGVDRFHEKSNEKLIRESGLLGRLTWAKVLWHPILSGYDNPETISQTFSKDLMITLQKNVGKVVGIFGMDANGGISGILPNSPAASSLDYATWYNSDEEYVVRISITNSCIKKFVSDAILLLDSQEKLRKFNEIMAGKPDEVKYPVNVFRDFQNLSVISR